jgi:uncharacterized iron-regulated protein
VALPADNDFPMTRRTALRAIAAVPMLLAARARATAAGPVTSTLADHPLVGRIWDGRAGRFTALEAVEAGCARADLVLLGETHDNPAHHRLQRALLDAMVRAGRRPAVAMEQFDREHQAALDRARSERPGDAEQVADAGRFDRRGWQWPLYEPIVALALRHGLPLVAANLSRADAARVVELGFEALGAEQVARLGLDRPLSAALGQGLEATVRDSHCGQLPERIVPRMARAQQARDAVLAERLLARSAAGAALIAGNGHVRRDLGVPAHLAVLTPGRNALCIGILEVEDGVNHAEAYLVPATGDEPRFDLALFTPRAARGDPCAGINLR